MQLKSFSLICLVWLFAITLKLSAQTQLSGTVTDATTNEPVIGENVIIKELQKGAVTNAQGIYNIEVPNGKYTIVFSSIGYETIEKKVICDQPKTILDVKVKESVTQMEEVVVTGKSEARKLREQAMPIAVITMNELQGTVSDVSDVLSKTTGVQLRTSGGEGSATRISVRGLEGKRIGFFINGTPLNDQSEFIDLNDIPIDLIDRIEVYKGIVPAKFGGSAVGGAVNIVTKEYPPQYLDASYSIQSFNIHKASAVYKRNKKGYEAGIGGFYTYAENNYEMELPLQPGKKVIRDHDKFKKIAIAGGFSSKNWWFDEVELEPVALFTEKEIQGIEYNIQEAKSYSVASDILTCNSVIKHFPALVRKKEMRYICGCNYNFQYFREKPN